MSESKVHPVNFRRKRKNLTNYKKRLKLLLSGNNRLVVRKSLNNISAQVVEYGSKGDKIVVSAHSSELKKLGWKAGTGNIPGAYLTGLLLGKKSSEKGIKEMVVDLGLNKSIKGSRIYALLKGVSDSGIKVPHSKGILPADERIQGEHIKKYASSIKKDSEDYKRRFSGYIKKGVEPEKIPEIFKQVKDKMIGGK